MTIRHILEESGRSISRNRTTFLLATSVLAVCLTLLSVFLVATVNVAAIGAAARRKVELYAFLSENADPQPLEAAIRRISGVTGTRFVSPDEALEELRADLGEDASVIDVLGENPLPATIRANLEPGFTAAERLADIERKIGLLAGVTEVWSGRELIVRLERILRAAVISGISILVIVSLSIAFIVFQTVDAAVTSRSREIEIMGLVGATRVTVCAPFAIEGTLQGLGGGIIAFLLVFVLYRAACAVLPRPVFPAGLVLGFVLGLGALLGLLGSLVALNRIRS